MFKQKKRLILFVTILLITGFLITSICSYIISLSSLRHQVTHAELPLTSDTIYSEIQRDLLRPIFISSLMASDTFLRDWVLQGENEKDKIVRYLSEIQKTYHAFTTFFVSEKTRNYYHPDGILKQVHPEDPEDSWYFRVSDLQENYEINIDSDMANEGTLTVFINYRVYDYANNFIGVTGIGLPVTAVQQIINQYQQTYNRDILFLDREGQIRLSNNSSDQTAQHTKELQKLTQDGDFIKKVTTTAPTAFQYEIDGHPVSLNSRFIKEFGWYLVVIQYELKGKTKLVRTLLFNLLFCAIITVVILLITNHTITTYQREIEIMATTDKLTGLYNRQALDMLFKQLLIDQNRNPDDLSLLLLDIDHFKRVNDDYGHLAGDAVLEHLATLLTSRLREADIICRWGGEEFIILLKGCDLETTYNMAEELRLGIMNHPLRFDGISIAITISIGIAKHQPHDTRESLIGRADKAMYKAKANGRNQVVSA